MLKLLQLMPSPEERVLQFFPEETILVERPDLTNPISVSIMFSSVAIVEKPSWVEVPSIQDSWEDLTKYLCGFSERMQEFGHGFEVVVQRRVHGICYGYNRAKVSKGVISLDAFDPKTGKVPSTLADKEFI